MTVVHFRAAFSRFARISCIFAVLFAFINARAQSSTGTGTNSGTDTLVRVSDVPRIISYQGQLTTANGQAMNGTHKITATLYSDHLGTNAVWQGSYSAEITGGVFSVELGAGSQKLPDNAAMNQPLWVGIKVDGGDEMQPLTKLAAAPYALNVPDRSITMAKLAPDVVLGIGKTPIIQTVFDNPCGNNSSSGTNSVVAGGCADTASGDYSFVGGGADNAAAGYASAIVGGGGNKITSAGNHSIIAGGSADTIYAEYAFVGSGNNNSAGATGTGSASAVVGGHNNMAQSTNSFVGSGQYNTVDNSSLDGTITGGNSNAINASGDAFIGAGAGNTVNGLASSIVGGESNLQDGLYSFLGGGEANVIGGYNFESLSGGFGDTIQIANYATIGGGRLNVIHGTNTLSTSPYAGDYSVIAGGDSNIINGDFSAIPGGRNLEIGARSFGFNEGKQLVDISGSSDLAYFGDVDLWLGNDNKIPSKLKFFERSDSGSNFTSFQAQDQTANILYRLPNSLGSLNQALTLTTVTGDTGILGWGPGGATAWNITGNSNTDPSTGQFLGTNNNKAFEIHVNDSGVVNQGDKRVMRFEPNATSANIIGGFQGNSVDSGVGSIICGGGMNTGANQIKDDFNVIVGGDSNSITSNLDTARTLNAFIGGGRNNHISADPELDEPICIGAAIVGGFNNTVQDSATFIGAGSNNSANEQYAIVVGGKNNKDNTWYSFIGGGHDNKCDGTPPNAASGDTSSIVGGSFNSISGKWSFIGGGTSNWVQTNSSSIVGGVSNKIAWLSADRDSHSAFIGGGSDNLVKYAYGNIPGGQSLTAQSYAQTVIGYLNQVQGTSKIPTPGIPNSINPNDRVFIVGAGQSALTAFGIIPARVEILKNAFEVTNKGSSIVYDNHGSTHQLVPDTIITVAVDSATPVIKGARSVDNTCIAWGNIDAAGVITSSFGVQSAIWGVGVCTVTLNYVFSDTDPNGTGGTQVNTINGSAITATTVYIPGTSHPCTGIQVEPISIVGGHYTFKVHTWDASSSCATYVPEPFMFHVFARP